MKDTQKSEEESAFISPEQLGTVISEIKQQAPVDLEKYFSININPNGTKETDDLITFFRSLQDNPLLLLQMPDKLFSFDSTNEWFKKVGFARKGLLGNARSRSRWDKLVRSEYGPIVQINNDNLNLEPNANVASLLSRLKHIVLKDLERQDALLYLQRVKEAARYLTNRYGLGLIPQGTQVVFPATQFSQFVFRIGDRNYFQLEPAGYIFMPQDERERFLRAKQTDRANPNIYRNGTLDDEDFWTCVIVYIHEQAHARIAEILAEIGITFTPNLLTQLLELGISPDSALDFETYNRLHQRSFMDNNTAAQSVASPIDEGLAIIRESRLIQGILEDSSLSPQLQALKEAASRFKRTREVELHTRHRTNHSIGWNLLSRYRDCSWEEIEQILRQIDWSTCLAINTVSENGQAILKGEVQIPHRV